MNDNNIQQNIQNNVLEKIRSGQIQIKPKAYFVARLSATIFITIVILVLSAFILSFILFSVRESGQQFLLGFGSMGIYTFLSLFPWTLLLIDTVMIFVLERLLKGFKFGYRISALSIFIWAFIASTVLGMFVSLTPIHNMLLEYAEQDELPFIGDTYQSIHDSHSDQGVFKGTVVSVDGDNVTIINDEIYDEDDGVHTIELPKDHGVVNLDDTIYVLGSVNGEVIEAHGFQNVHNNKKVK